MVLSKSAVAGSDATTFSSRDVLSDTSSVVTLCGIGWPDGYTAIDTRLACEASESSGARRRESSFPCLALKQSDAVRGAVLCSESKSNNKHYDRPIKGKGKCKHI